VILRNKLTSNMGRSLEARDWSGRTLWGRRTSALDDPFIFTTQPNSLDVRSVYARLLTSRSPALLRRWHVLPASDGYDLIIRGHRLRSTHRAFSTVLVDLSVRLTSWRIFFGLCVIT
jgi:hypothetical protein